MTAIALTRTSQLIHVTDVLERLGYSPERMLEQAQLPLWHYCDPDDLIPAHHIYALMAHAARSLGSPTFGLMVGADNSVTNLGTFDRLIANSLTVYHALESGCRLIPLHSSAGRYSLIETSEEVWCCRSQFSGPDIGRRENEHYILMRMVEYVRMAAGPSWMPAKVCVQMAKAPEPELREVLGDSEVFFEKKFTGIAVPRALLAKPLQRRGVEPIDADEALEEQLRRTAPDSSFVGALRQLVETLLREEGPPGVETMAEIAGLSVRSLQRRLAKYGLTPFQILDQARYQTAARLLVDPDIRITDVAMDLGYTDSAHFTRAFKRWAGVTPREYRSHQRML